MRSKLSIVGVRCVLFLVLVALPISGVCQALDEDLLNSAVFIKRSSGGNRTTAGSGFLIVRIISTDQKNTNFQVVLVTNKHMLPKEGSAEDTIVLKIAIRTGSSLEVKEIPVTVLAKDGKYTSAVAMHPDPKVDVAAIIVTPQLKKENTDYVIRILESHHAVTTDLLLPKSQFRDDGIGIGTEIYTLGYPAGISDPRNTSPLLRLGIISTEPDKDYSFDLAKSALWNLPMPIPGFLIDANVFPGSSGSMVFRKTNNTFGSVVVGKLEPAYILGIVADSVPMHDEALGTNERIQLGVVFNSDSILETINLLPKQ